MSKKKKDKEVKKFGCTLTPYGDGTIGCEINLYVEKEIEPFYKIFDNIDEFEKFAKEFIKFIRDGQKED